MAEPYTVHGAPGGQDVPPDIQEITLKLEDVHCTGCADEIERIMRAQPHISSVHLDWADNMAHVSYYSGLTNSAEIELLVATTWC